MLPGIAVIGLLMFFAFFVSTIALPRSVSRIWCVVIALIVGWVANVPYDRWSRRRYPVVCHRCDAVFYRNGFALLGWSKPSGDIELVKCPNGHWAWAHMVSPRSLPPNDGLDAGTEETAPGAD
jgi:hypothetical protein